MKRLLTLFIIALVSFPSASHAALDWSPCAADVATHCHGLTLGTEEAAQCLEKLVAQTPSSSDTTTQKLTSECSATVRHWQFHQRCKGDIETLCSKVEPGSSRLHDCIRQNAEKVSVACGLFIQDYLGIKRSYGGDLDC